MSEWITDRQPTEEDAFEGYVFAMNRHNEVEFQHVAYIELGMPWQPIPKPTPYVKPKRWTVQWCNKTKLYKLRFNGLYLCIVPELCCDEIAERIENLFNEVMP
jgi:hypothetical protein